jgi:septal ring factor EnvC (AmiA/AmiB activator)
MRRARRSSLIAVLLLTTQAGPGGGEGTGVERSEGAGPGPGLVTGVNPGPSGGAAGQDSRQPPGTTSGHTVAGQGSASRAGQAPATAGRPGQNPATVAGDRSQPTPAPAALDRESATRRQVEASERIQAMQIEAQSEATEQAAQALADEKRLTGEQREALERLRVAEAALNTMRQHMLDLDRRRADAQTGIDKHVAALRPVLPVIVRMSAYPIETLLGAQLPAEDAVRGILVLRNIARQAEADARSLVEDREALDAATKAAEDVAPQLAAAEAARLHEAEALALQLAQTKERRQAAEHDAADAARRAAAEAARATSLRSMLQVLETQRRLEEARAREDLMRAERDQKEAAAEAARLRQAALSRPAGAGTLAANARPAGQVTPPVAGSLVRGWGDQDDGEPATGQSWQTESGASVVAPCGGTVAFAEAFRGYGLLVIIDCGGGFHAVLGGLDRIEVTPGRAIAAGDLIGAMRAAPAISPVGSRGASPGVSSIASDAASDVLPGVASGATSGVPSLGTSTVDTSLTSGTSPAAASGAPPLLYFELRRSGRPVNPAPWLKPSG